MLRPHLSPPLSRSRFRPSLPSVPFGPSFPRSSLRSSSRLLSTLTIPIESDGNEEVRDVRREVVREVERALEEVERKVKEQAPQAPVAEVTKQDARDVESEEPSNSGPQTIPPAVVHVTEAAERTEPNLAAVAPVASQTDVDIDVAISAEYQSGSRVATVSGVVISERDNAAGESPANGNADTEDVPSSEDASDSITTITPAPVARAVPGPSSSDKSASTSAAGAETFLTSLSHDQFTFPPRPAFSQTSTNSGVSQDDDAVVVDNSSEGGSMRSVDDEWATEFDA
ncbi:hypothetical protein BGY98DRAFT_353220 [Russula aff. rugulosa BPL654]|nr:hypothetical protein BGY98DRAFT_353220 [Russula aff. rugulosa BPL654]